MMRAMTQRRPFAFLFCAVFCVGAAGPGSAFAAVTRNHDAVLDVSSEASSDVSSEVPLPPPRPPEFSAPTPSAADAGLLRPPAETPQDNMALRVQILASGVLSGESLPALAGPGACGIAAPLRLDAIVLQGGDKVAIQPPVVMRASLARALADWLRIDLAPALTTKDDRLARIEGAGAYECRSRNRLAGEKLSEHAIGNALDMHALETLKGRRIAVAPTLADAAANQDFLALMKKTACARFMTVLGPGSDGFHAEHLHVDLEARHSGAHLCQWNLPAATAAAAPPHH
jgi:hypothetical protein